MDNLGGKVNSVKWKEIPFRTGKSVLRIRYSASRQAEVLFKINGSICGTKTLSATSQWETVEIATYEQGSEALNGIYSFIGYGRP